MHVSLFRFHLSDVRVERISCKNKSDAIYRAINIAQSQKTSYKIQTKDGLSIIRLYGLPYDSLPITVMAEFDTEAKFLVLKNFRPTGFPESVRFYIHEAESMQFLKSGVESLTKEYNSDIGAIYQSEFGIALLLRF